MEDYLIGIGKRIKKIRKEKTYTIQETAKKAGVSNGLISRIENGRTIPSLPVLLNIIGALEVPVTQFFENMVPKQKTKFIVTKACDYSVLEKEVEAQGFVYKFIFNKQLSSMGFEAVLLEVQPNAKRDFVCTDAYEFKYILSGKITYNIDGEMVVLEKGDSLFFDGRLPHVPINNHTESSTMLVLYFFLNEKE